MDEKTPVSLSQLISYLNDDFEHILYIDFEKDSIVPYRLNGKEERFDEMKFSTFLDTVSENKIAYYDKKVLKKIFNKDYLSKQLRDKQYYTYQLKSGSYEHSLFRMIKIVNTDAPGEPEHIVAGIAYEKSEFNKSNTFSNSRHSALVVDDNEIDRGILSEILSQKYDIIEAENGKEAYEKLEKYSDEIAVILTDLEMPVCDGYTLLKRISSIRAFNSIPVLVTTISRYEEIEVQCLGLGASDFIVKPYNPEIVLNRVMSHTRLRESSAMLDTLQTDKLTGLYTKEFFTRYVQQTLNSNSEKNFSIICSEIENFKSINEKYGEKTGDDILVYTAESILKNIDGILYGCRFNGDIFAFIQTSDKESALNSEVIEKISAHSPVTPVSLKFGIYRIEDDIPVLAMIDRAVLAVRQIKDTYKKYISVYDDQIREKIIRQKFITDNMETALREHQFSVYYQPKHDIESGRITGAEALLRWNHPSVGSILTSEFIPVFEKNGFIVKLDEYVLHECCSSLSEWISHGLSDFHISINISRRDFEDDNLADKIERIIDSYVIPHSYIHIEITESVYTDNQQRAEKTVKQLHDKGFVIELDDFGTGYSSLAVLNSENLDVLKFDVSLIENDSPDSEKSALVFASQLAQMMNLYTVAEGIENASQLERVKKLKCNSSQGFVYSEAIPKEKFEEYMKSFKK
ncbi:MAG: EAL domain-containing protein [Oscillospiraceae bacterium]|nr:EAL domain-containing protein [Oscillospiraceae bacterium]